MEGKSINRRKSTNTKNQIKNTVVQEPQKKSITTKPQNIVFNKKLLYLYVFLLIFITFGVFSFTFKNSYTNWDDGKYVEENPLIKTLDSETVKEIFASENLHYRYWMGNYHPLTMLSLNINYAFAEKDEKEIAKPFGFQLVNIILHILNTLLVFVIVSKLLKNINIAFFVALLFGVHTLHVESVTWIAERKDVLYTFFFLISLLFYIFYVEKNKFLYIITSFIFFILSLLSKGQATTLALTIILVDYFYNRLFLNNFLDEENFSKLPFFEKIKKSVKSLSIKVIIEKIPFFILAFIFGIIAIEAQKQGSALQIINTAPIISRIGVAVFGFSMYLLKLVIPFGLSAIYPYHDIINQTIPAYFWLGVIPVFLVGYLAVKSLRNNKLMFFSIGFFVANVILLLQLIPVGSAIYADRYVYISSIGFYIILVNFVYKIKQTTLRNLLFGTYIVIICIMTINRIAIWKDSKTLWEDVVKKQPKAVVAWNNLGSEYNRESAKFKKNNDIENYFIYNQKAIDCLTKAIEQKPDYTSAYYNRGFSYKDLGVYKNDTLFIKKSIDDFSKSIASDLTFVLAYQERGTAYDWLGNYEKAISDYNMALQYEPKNTAVIINRGTSKGKNGDFKGAIEDFNTALKINPDLNEAISNRGLAYAFLRQYDLAIADYNKAIEIEASANTYFNRGLAFFNQKEFQKAKQDFEQALNLNNSLKEALYYIEICEKELKL